MEIGKTNGQREPGAGREYAATILAWLAAVWVIFGTIGLLALAAVGESGPVTAALLFLPPWAWMVPSAGIAIASLFLRPVLLVPLALQAVWFHGLHLSPGWRVMPPPYDPGDSITLVTFNRGGSLNGSFETFAKQADADIILLQEANLLLEKYRIFFPGHHAAVVDEYLILSRFPIVGQEPVYLQTSQRGLPCAARFVLDVGARQITVFNVHMPTPRFVLSRWWDPTARTIPFYGEPDVYWNDRLALARQLADLVVKEEQPVILAGDFNMVDRARLYRIFGINFVDLHREQGWGYGFTYPGHAIDPFGRLGPWLRLDYIFVSHTHWQVLESRVEPPRKTAHRAVLGRIRLLESNPAG